MPDIVISEFIDAAPVAALREKYDVLSDETLWDKPAELKAALTDAVAIIVRNRTQVTAEVIEAAPRLRAVGRLGVGLDNIDLAACRARNIAVLPATGGNAVSVAEYVLCASMLLLRGTAFFGSQRLANGEWPRAEMSQGQEISGKVLGLIGFGSIGQSTGELARNAGFVTLAYDDFVPADSPAWAQTEHVSLDDLLARSDVVSLHCPLTDDTRGLIGEREINSMKPGAILINTARGGIVSEAAVAAALRSGHLAGAALDVFETEPIDKDSAAAFKGLANVILTPHIAGVTREANIRISAVTVENVLKVLNNNETP
ncbi:hydroxyacid dehydrogenase [Filomicrobium sp.]|uniref:hydroxyacid dehydrogenase n=1 Tax=Filomicrobium sp. TaxID=2024831 RepID=UPI00258689CF|nr:hydroxyacid dehydrogenase [Filomicrobium sp.]MCV0370338.1 hydroxyacid dehydrogenase [Filomicrobium sp.]